MFDPVKIVIALALVVLATTVRAGGQTIETVIELIEVKGLASPAQKVLNKEVRRVSPGEPLTYQYQRPDNGHQYTLVFKLHDVGSREKHPNLVRMSISWVDVTDNKVEKQIDDVAIDGSFLLTLYAADRPGSDVALRLTPTVLR